MCLRRFSCRNEVSWSGSVLERSSRTLPRFLVPLRGAGCLLERGIHLKTANTHTRWLSVHFFRQNYFLFFYISRPRQKDHQDESMAQMHLHVLCRYQDSLVVLFPETLLFFQFFFLMYAKAGRREADICVCVCVRACFKLLQCGRMTYSFLHKLKEFRIPAGFSWRVNCCLRSLEFRRLLKSLCELVWPCQA